MTREASFLHITKYNISNKFALNNVTNNETTVSQLNNVTTVSQLNKRALYEKMLNL